MLLLWSYVQWCWRSISCCSRVWLERDRYEFHDVLLFCTSFLCFLFFFLFFFFFFVMFDPVLLVHLQNNYLCYSVSLSLCLSLSVGLSVCLSVCLSPSLSLSLSLSPPPFPTFLHSLLSPLSPLSPPPPSLPSSLPHLPPSPPPPSPPTSPLHLHVCPSHAPRMFSRVFPSLPVMWVFCI